MNFGAQITARGPDLHVAMQGDLDEEAKLPPLAQTPQRLTIDLGGVRLINSMGCRRWVTWITEVAATAGEVQLERCSHAVIQQMNILGGFLPPKVKVTSFFVPYECPRCGHGARVLHANGADFKPESVPEHLTCAACGGEMILEILRPAYFRFLSPRSA